MARTNADRPRPAKEKVVRSCECGKWAVLVETPEQLSKVPTKHQKAYLSGSVTHGGAMLRTDCEATCSGTFAPGHDARLKGILRTAYLGDLQVVELHEGERHPLRDPLQAGDVAARFGFYLQVTAPATEKAARPARAPKAATKAARQAAEPEGQPLEEEEILGMLETLEEAESGDDGETAGGLVWIRIGRQNHLARIADNGSAEIREQDGTYRVVPQDGYRLVA